MTLVEDRFVETALKVATTGASEALRWFRGSFEIENKSVESFDPVTNADRAAEQAMRSLLTAAFPEHGILGEEFGETPSDGPWRWVLDPVDGTRGFLSGAPTWTTLVALEHAGVPQVGVIRQPYTEETWVGRPGATVFSHRDEARAARVSTCRDLESARISTTDPRARPAGYFRTQEALAFEELSRKTLVARFSHDAYAYGLLALGSLDLVVESSLQVYDVAALVPVVEGAGGTITNWRGGSDLSGGRTLAAATPELHSEALQILLPFIRDSDG